MHQEIIRNLVPINMATTISAFKVSTVLESRGDKHETKILLIEE
jgi:hypothetical protein